MSQQFAKTIGRLPASGQETGIAENDNRKRGLISERTQADSGGLGLRISPANSVGAWCSKEVRIVNLGPIVERRFLERRLDEARSQKQLICQRVVKNDFV